MKKTRSQAARMKASAADNDRNPMKTPSRTGNTVKRLTGKSAQDQMSPSGPLSSRSPNVPMTSSFIDALRGNASGPLLAGMNLQAELGQEQQTDDGAGDEHAQQSWSERMRNKAAKVPKALVMVQGGVGTGYQQFLKERHNASMTNDELIATYKNQLLQGTPPKLRDIFWGNMNELNYYISAYIADLVMEHYADTETTDLPKEDESVLAPIMTMIETTPILNNQAVKMRLMGKNFYESPFVYKALCVIFTCDQELTSAISILNARLGRMNGTAVGVALKEQPTCFGDLTLKSVGLIALWRQSTSRVLETLKKEIVDFNTMMPDPNESFSGSVELILGRAVELEQMIYSFVELLTDKDEDTVEAVNVQYSSTLIKFFGIAEAVIQYGDTDAGKITAKIFAQYCAEFMVRVEEILSEEGPIATLAPKIIREARNAEESTRKSVRDMFQQQSDLAIDQRIDAQVPNLPNILTKSGVAKGTQSARYVGAPPSPDGTNGGTYGGRNGGPGNGRPGRGSRRDGRGDGGRGGRIGGRVGGRTGGGRNEQNGGNVTYDSQNRRVPHSTEPTPGRQQREVDPKWDPTCGVWFWQNDRWMRQSVAGEDGKTHNWNYCDICGNHGHKPELCGEILERATCGLEATKVRYSSARFHAASPRIGSPSFDISPNIPTVGAFKSYSLRLEFFEFGF